MRMKYLARLSFAAITLSLAVAAGVVLVKSPKLSDELTIRKLSQGLDHAWVRIGFLPLSSLPKEVDIGYVPSGDYKIGLIVPAHSNQDCEAIGNGFRLRLLARMIGDSAEYRIGGEVGKWIASFPSQGIQAVDPSIQRCTLYPIDGGLIPLSRYEVRRINLSIVEPQSIGIDTALLDNMLIVFDYTQ